MAGGVLGRVRIVQVGDAVIPVVGKRPTQVGARHERQLTLEHQLGLERVCEIGALGARPAVVNKEDRQRPRPLGNLAVERGRRHRPLHHVQLEATRARHRGHARPAISGPAQRQFDRLRAWDPPPHWRAAARSVAVRLGLGLGTPPPASWT